MKIYDKIVKIDNIQENLPNRIKNGLIYSFCHEQNKINHDNNKHYFVFSNNTNNSYCLIRSTINCDSNNNNIVEYDINSYKDYMLFTGQNSKDNKHFVLVNAKKIIPHILTKQHINDSKELYETYSKIVYCKKNNQNNRPIWLRKTEYVDVDISNYDVVNGVGARTSYGCGLIIPTSVYNHLLNFVVK